MPPEVNHAYYNCHEYEKDRHNTEHTSYWARYVRHIRCHSEPNIHAPGDCSLGFAEQVTDHIKDVEHPERCPTVQNRRASNRHDHGWIMP